METIEQRRQSLLWSFGQTTYSILWYLGFHFLLKDFLINNKNSSLYFANFEDTFSHSLHMYSTSIKSAFSTWNWFTIVVSLPIYHTIYPLLTQIFSIETENWSLRQGRVSHLIFMTRHTIQTEMVAEFERSEIRGNVIAIVN